MNKYFYDYNMNYLPNDILDIICKDLIKKEEDIFRKLSWKYRKIYLKNIKYLLIKLYEFNNYYILNANIYLKDKIFYVLNGYINNNKIFYFNILNNKINISVNNKIFLIYYYLNIIMIYNTIFGFKKNPIENKNIIKNNEIIYQNSKYGRTGHTRILYKNNVYIFGGFNWIFLNDLLIYNLDTNTIKRYETNLNPRADHNVILYENEMYIFGGFN